MATERPIEANRRDEEGSKALEPTEKGRALAPVFRPFAYHNSLVELLGDRCFDDLSNDELEEIIQTLESRIDQSSTAVGLAIPDRARFRAGGDVT